MSKKSDFKKDLEKAIKKIEDAHDDYISGKIIYNDYVILCKWAVEDLTKNTRKND